MNSAAQQAQIAFQSNLYQDPNPTRRWLHNVRREWVFSKIDEYTSTPRTRVVEVGVGAGLYTRHLAQRQCRIWAVDINADFVNAVSALPDTIALCCDATTGLPKSDFDLALCSEVLEHVLPQESIALLKSLHDSVVPGGHVILTTPQRTSTMEWFARLLRFRPILALARALYGNVAELGHINVLSTSELRAQFSHVGLEVVESTQLALYIPGLAEFGGRPGQKIAAALGSVLRNSFLSGLLWTQAYVLRRPA